MLNSEFLPRRNSCQVLDINIRKKVIFFLNFAQKKRNKLESILLISLNKWNSFEFKFSKKISFPFGSCFNPENICLFTNKRIIFKEKGFHPKIFSPKNFKANCQLNSKKRFFSFILDKNLKKNGKFLRKFLKKRQNLSWIELKEPIPEAFFKSLNSSLNYFPKGPVLSVKFSSLVCKKKYYNNFYQIFGNSLEFIQKGFYNIKSFSLKNHNSFDFRIF